MSMKTIHMKTVREVVDAFWKAPTEEDEQFKRDAMIAHLEEITAQPASPAPVGELEGLDVELLARKMAGEDWPDHPDDQEPFVEQAARLLPLLAERERGLRATNERLYDLVRHQRGELYEAELISDEELASLASAQGSVERLTTYDDLRAQLASLRETGACGHLKACWQPERHVTTEEHECTTVDCEQAHCSACDSEAALAAAVVAQCAAVVAGSHAEGCNKASCKCGYWEPAEPILALHPQDALTKRIARERAEARRDEHDRWCPMADPELTGKYHLLCGAGKWECKRRKELSDEIARNTIQAAASPQAEAAPKERT